MIYKAETTRCPLKIKHQIHSEAATDSFTGTEFVVKSLNNLFASFTFLITPEDNILMSPLDEKTAGVTKWQRDGALNQDVPGSYLVFLMNSY